MQRFLLLLLAAVSCQAVSVYDYFSEGGITQGLTATDSVFKLNGKEFKILSGSLHYFRVHPDYWRTRMQQYKAAGLNTLDVYVPWNLHEPRKGEFDFGEGSSQFSPFLNITRFIEMAKEEDLLVMFRPGPYICGEWEFGGLPSWLLHDSPMFVRTSYAPYQERAELFLVELIARVKDLQFYTDTGMKGGPIIMTQIENEYGNFGYTDYPRDKDHLRFLKSVLRREGIESLLFTSDSPSLALDWGNVDYELMTANFKWNSIENLDKLLEMRPNAPILVSEYWPGWFDHWFEEQHNTLSEADFRTILGNIFSYNGSVNFYMFFGGTNFGYMNGGNILGYAGAEIAPVYVPDVTSYDYDAPISESGQYTDKYYAAQEMIAAYDPLYDQIDRPQPPAVDQPVAYPDVEMVETASYTDLIGLVNPDDIESREKPASMEELNLHDGNGQSYGYIVYRKSVSIRDGSTLKIRGHIRDLAQVLVNGQVVSDPVYSSIHLLNHFGSWAIRDSEFSFPSGLGCEESCVLELFVENLGRANFGAPHNFNQKKGIWEGDILLGDVIQDGWEHIPLEIDAQLLNSVQWKKTNRAGLDMGPKLLQGSFNVEGEPKDTYFDYDCEECSEWLHGAVWVNGFNVGRYFQGGPQKTLYIPGPLLRTGQNTIVVFESYLGSTTLKFTATPNYGPIN